MNEQKPKDDHYYEYIHVNGSTIRKPAIVVDMGGGPEEYFNSPFVKSWKLVIGKY